MPAVVVLKAGQVARLPRAIVSGFAATSAMSLVLVMAYVVARILGDPTPGPGTPLRWLYALVDNAATGAVNGSLYPLIGLHILIGLAWAIVYAFIVEPRLPIREGWLKGVYFSFIPWLLSIFVALPAMGAGVAGLKIGAGPLPMLGNLIIHLVYGWVLGYLYVSDVVIIGETQRESDEQMATMADAEKGLAVGIITGAIVGIGVGWLIGSAVPLLSANSAAPALIGAIVGSALGALAGSMIGLDIEHGEARRRSV